MRDLDLYRQLLGLEAPWTVTRVELAVEAGRVDVWAGHLRGCGGLARLVGGSCPPMTTLPSGPSVTSTTASS